MCGCVAVVYKCMHRNLWIIFSVEVLAAMIWLCAGKREKQGLSASCDVHVGMCRYVGCPFRELSLMSRLHPWTQKEKASPQGSWETHWATFPTFGPGLWTLKGADTHTSLLHLSLPFHAVFLSLSLPIFLSRRGRIQHQCTHKGRVTVYGSWYFFPSLSDWCLEGCLQTDKNLWWTVKHSFVYCFASGLHK